MKKTLPRLVLGAALLVVSTASFAHCQIPCGIYTDAMRFDIIEEHAKTIEKSMKQIVALSAESPVNYNQLVRWVHNKEQHAQEIQDIVDHYFLTQRVKAKDESNTKAHAAYVKHLTLLHQMLVAAMKCKQTTDVAHVAELRALAAAYKEHYFAKHDH